MKTCSKCNIEKDESLFGKRSYSSDGLRSECKECRSKDHLENKELRNKRTLDNYYKNRDVRLMKMSEYKYKNRNLDGKLIKLSLLKEGISELDKVCSKCFNIVDKKNFTKDNSKSDKLHSHCNTCRGKYKMNRVKSDPIYKLITSIRSRISQSLGNLNISKDRKTISILGCSLDEFRYFIESKFTEGMSLSNYGEWHLDHIIPVSYAKNEEDVYLLNHYTNFQPLWSKDNLSKGNRYIG